jgi:hypothetical protein
MAAHTASSTEEDAKPSVEYPPRALGGQSPQTHVEVCSHHDGLILLMMTEADPRAEFPFADLALARRLERTEATMNAQCVMARAARQPSSGAAWIDVEGTYAMFDIVGSPLTQTFGLGLNGSVADAAMREMERFFESRGADICHEVSPLADPSAAAQLNARGYRPVEFTSVMFRPLGGVPSRPVATAERLSVRRCSMDEADLWAATSARGWGETPELGAFMLEFGQMLARRTGALSFLVESGGAAIAAGGLSISGGVALLAGASTVPEGRNQGAQLALLETRLRFAAEQGCDLAMMCASPGSASQRNAERQGFRIAYTRIKWHRPAAGAQ